MQNLKYYLVALVFVALAGALKLHAQALSGIPGLVQIPTADFMKDGTFYVGGNYIPKESLGYSDYQHDGLVIFASLTFLPFLEIDMRFTKQLGVPADAGHTADRSPSIRFRMMRERAYRPSIGLGIHDVFSTVEEGQARHFGATYLVSSKHFFIDKFMVAPSLGYGFDILQSDGKELLGFFYGLKIRSAYFQPVAFLLDYDTKYINLGMDIVPLKVLHLKLALLNFRYFAAGASMHFDLFDVF